jgi:hypothetical protein
MTPEREKLLRLALAMPEEAVATIGKSITWICPGLTDAKMPVFVREKVELLADLRRVASDPELRGLLSQEIDRMKAGHVPPEPFVGNVVALFSGWR